MNVVKFGEVCEVQFEKWLMLGVKNGGGDVSRNDPFPIFRREQNTLFATRSRFKKY
jgi:hypothetical protein